MLFYRSKKKDDIKTNLREIEHEILEWMKLVQVKNQGRFL
jgi:hypothetical protein